MLQIKKKFIHHSFPMGLLRANLPWLGPFLYLRCDKMKRSRKGKGNLHNIQPHFIHTLRHLCYLETICMHHIWTRAALTSVSTVKDITHVGRYQNISLTVRFGSWNLHHRLCYSTRRTFCHQILRQLDALIIHSNAPPYVQCKCRWSS